MTKEQAFEDIVSDIIYMFPQTSQTVAEQCAITFIRNPKMLIELNEMVREKKKS